MDQPNTFYTVYPIGFVRSVLKGGSEAPCQGFEGAPDAWIDLDHSLSEAYRDIREGQEILLLTWFHLARRDVLKLHPRNNPANPEKGVFSTRSQDRPNPIGLHPVRVMEVQGNRIRVSPLEAFDGTPVIDIKPVI